MRTECVKITTDKNWEGKSREKNVEKSTERD